MTTLTDSERLLRAVLLDPADDLARLAYADALDEEGKDGWAELVRDGVKRPDRTEPVDRGWAKMIGRPWLTPPECQFCGQITWRRGLVESVRCTLAAWMEYGVALCARHPVTAVEATDARPHAAANGLHYWSMTFLAHEPSHRLPDAIACHLPYPRPRHRGYPSATDALAALSLACVNWARGENGLPPLKE